MSKIDTRDMARFVAHGYLMFEGIVPAEVNELYLAQVNDPGVPEVPAGTPLAKAYPAGSALRALFDLPDVRDKLDSLVGPDPLVDHHFVHLTLGTPERERFGIHTPLPSQHWHQDSTIDTRVAFDVQIMWYPHDVTLEMGGTRFLPGSHLRVVSEAAIARYQNIRGQRHVVCPAGSLLFLHHGMWHGGGSNRSDRTRHMVKVRLNPTVPQVRLWDDSDLTPDDFVQQPIFWTRSTRRDDDLAAILCEAMPWHEADTHRLEFVNRIRLFRHLLGDDSFDADYWLSRLDNQPAPRTFSA